MKIPIIRIITFVFLSSGVLRAQVPNLLNYQGRVAVGTVNFEGTGQFKFSLVNGDGSVTYWSNDGTSTVGSEPTAAVTLSVSKGLYSVLLGDSTLANMTVIPSTVWANADVRLRVWFNDGTNGSQMLAPDQRISPSGYLPDGSVTSSKMAPNLALTGTVTAERFVESAAEPPSDVYPANGMVWIKPGKFLMGSRVDEAGRSSDEATRQFVTLTKGFWIGCHEVTQGEYQAVMGNNPSYFVGDNNRPVEQVSWNNAVAYCTTLTSNDRGLSRLPAGWGYRLPTEAEWEYCCRAGARTTRFSFGDDLASVSLASYGWFSSNSSSTTQVVEQKLGNPWGLMDMHGNVWEWCQDWYGPYLGGSLNDPQGPVSGTDRVVRGGSWFSSANFCRSAQRFPRSPTFMSHSHGFRVVLSSGQP